MTDSDCSNADLLIIEESNDQPRILHRRCGEDKTEWSQRETRGHEFNSYFYSDEELKNRLANNSPRSDYRLSYNEVPANSFLNVPASMILNWKDCFHRIVLYQIPSDAGPSINTYEMARYLADRPSQIGTQVLAD